MRENLLSAADPRDRLAYLTDLVVPGHPPLPAPVVAAVEELARAAARPAAEDLSYGQRRLVAIARAVASSPSVLLLDEPAAGLDETESAELGRLIRRLADEWGMGVLLIEHDVALVLRPRPGGRPRLRAQDRRGHPRRGPQRPGGAQGVPRRGGRGNDLVRLGWSPRARHVRGTA